MVTRRPVLQHKTAGVNFTQEIVVNAALLGLSKVVRYQPAPFVNKKRIWEILRVAWTLQPGQLDFDPADNTPHSLEVAAVLLESRNLASAGFNLPQVGLGLHALNFIKAARDNVKILDQVALYKEIWVDQQGGAAGAGAAYTGAASWTHELPAGCFVVPENLYVQLRVKNWPVQSVANEFAAFATLDYYEHYIPTLDYIELAGVFGRGEAFFETL